ncbi:MAG: hypothetical protein AAB071_05400 [Bacteroidota bacterium]
MTDDILKEILTELKGLRQESINTNKHIDETNTRLDETNFEVRKLNETSGGMAMEQRVLRDETIKTRQRIDETNNRLDGLSADMKVLIISSNQLRDGMHLLRKVVSSNVIWQNDSIAIEMTDGATIKGTIHKV